jgi:hypothetical protein
MGKGVSLWRKPKHDSEVGASSKSKKQCARVTVHVDVVALYNNMTNCEGWDDVHLPDGWYLSARRVPMPPVPR